MTGYDAVVVGGGLVGSAAAYHLARAGEETLLVDRNDDGRATDAGAGIVFPPTSSRTESPEWFSLALAAADYYPELADAVGERGGAYARTGLLSVAADPAELPDFERERSRSRRRAEEYGRPRPDRMAEVSPDRARELYPPLGDVERAIHYEDGARVDGRAFAQALREAGREAGLTVERGDVTDVRVMRGAVRGVDTADGTSHDADAVLIAGGAWSSAVGADLGIELPVEPQRGQILHLDVGRVPTDRPSGEWPILKAFRHQYQVPWPDGRVACGATREAGSGFDPRITLGGLREVSTEALRIAPGLDGARHVESRVGLRPVSSDGLPILGPVPAVEGAFVATGHGPTGLTLGPYSGKLVAQVLRGVEPAASLAPFGVDRF